MYFFWLWGVGVGVGGEKAAPAASVRAARRRGVHAGLLVLSHTLPDNEMNDNNNKSCISLRI